MIHIPLSIHEGHWSVGKNRNKHILLQLQDECGEQVRVQLTPEEATDIAKILIHEAVEICK